MARVRWTVGAEIPSLPSTWAISLLKSTIIFLFAIEELLSAKGGDTSRAEELPEKGVDTSLTSGNSLISAGGDSTHTGTTVCKMMSENVPDVLSSQAVGNNNSAKSSSQETEIQMQRKSEGIVNTPSNHPGETVICNQFLCLSLAVTKPSSPWGCITWEIVLPKCGRQVFPLLQHR